MKLIILFFILIASINPISASQPYKAKTTPIKYNVDTPPPRPYSHSKKNKKEYKYVPTRKTNGALKEYIYAVPRKGVSIHDIVATPGNFEIKGSYKTERALELFIKNLKGDTTVDKSIEVKKSFTTFAGIKTYEFYISGKNRW